MDDGQGVRGRAHCRPVRADGADPQGRLLEGTLPSGALWRARLPVHWNGTLLLYSHGYSPAVRPPLLAPAHLEEWLLAHGYALAASSYSRAGWALAEAVPDQLATLDALHAQAIVPRQTLAWGESMGGLVTIALAEQAPRRIDGALPACGSIAGSLGMMNMALDGAFAFVTLVAPGQGIELVGVHDDRANGRRAQAALDEAMRSPAGRARVALAGTLAGLPGWTQPDAAQPEERDPDAQLGQLAQSFVMGVLLPRVDQEQRAGGVFSWNTGIDYRAQLAMSGRRSWVESFYRAAGLDLEQDLDTLAAAARIAGNPAAVSYMRDHYVPFAQPQVPVLSYHTIGDGLTSPSMQTAYGLAVRRNGRADRFSALWIRGAGHCAISPAEHVAALQTLQLRLRTGRWDVDPKRLDARAEATGLGSGRFVSFDAPAFLRPCVRTMPRCAGEPAGSTSAEPAQPPQHGP